jgi:two-component system, LytTR family, sensor kinase
MSNDNTAILKFVSEEERKRNRKFWTYTFLAYAIAEAGYILINYTITRSMCGVCVFPAAFYVLHLFANVIFTGLLWYCINIFYYQQFWKKIATNILLFVAHYIFWLVLQYAVLHSGLQWLTDKEQTGLSFKQLIFNSWFDIGKYVLKLSAFYVLKFYFEYRQSEKQAIQLAVINKDMQLNLLKQQLSPHFYFNTLNNLYGLARSNNQKLSAALDQLSNIMQYVITECNQSEVLLSKEVKFLESYIALEKLRYEQNTVIEMQVDGNANGQTVLPMVLIQFVENAFKHGMKEKSDQNWMKIKLAINKEELIFKVDNSFYTSDVNEGIGISSVKRILDLKYNGKYDMVMLHEAHQYSVTLKLNLS